MNKSGIEWCDHTWNPITGCRHGCSYCYADKMSLRFCGNMKRNMLQTDQYRMEGDLFVLDEPFNGLDLESAHILTLILQQLREGGKTVLVTSHVFETLTSCCDYIHHIDHGTIDRSYSKDQFEMLQKRLYSTIEDQASDQIKRLI